MRDNARMGGLEEHDDGQSDLGRLGGHLSRWETLGRLAVAWLGTGLLLILVQVAFGELVYDIAPQRERSLPWLLPLDDVWSVAASLPIVLLGLLVFTLLARRLLSNNPSGATVTLLPLAAILAVTGALATIPVREDGNGGSGLVMWLLAAYLARRLPAYRAEARPALPKRRLALAGAVLLVLGIAPVAMATLRSVDVSVSCPRSDGAQSDDSSGCVLRDRRAQEVNLMVNNLGRRPVTVLDLRLEGVPAPLNVDRLRLVPERGHARNLVLPVRLEPGDRQIGSALVVLARVRAPEGACRSLSEGLEDVVLATHLSLRYRVAGREVRRRLALGEAARIEGCNGRGVVFR